MGKNASGQTHYLSLSGLELYGTVTAVCEDQLGMFVFCAYFSPKNIEQVSEILGIPAQLLAKLSACVTLVSNTVWEL